MAVGLYIVPLMILALACAFLIATSKSYQYTFGTLLAKLADLFRAVSINTRIFGRIGLGAVADAIDTVNNFILAKLGEGITATSHGLVAVWGYMAHALTEIGKTVGDLAEGTERALSVLRRSVIPALIIAANGPLAALMTLARRQIAHLLARVERLAVHAVHAIPHVITKLETRVVRIERVVVKTVTSTIPRAIAVPWPRIRGLEREAASLWKRVGKLERAGAIVGVGAVASVVLGRLGLGWARCSKVGRLGKAVCGMDESLIESLLAGALVVAGSISIVELARECAAFTGEVDDGLRFFVRELH